MAWLKCSEPNLGPLPELYRLLSAELNHHKENTVPIHINTLPQQVSGEAARQQEPSLNQNVIKHLEAREHSAFMKVGGKSGTRVTTG